MRAPLAGFDHFKSFFASRLNVWLHRNRSLKCNPAVGRLCDQSRRSMSRAPNPEPVIPAESRPQRASASKLSNPKLGPVSVNDRHDQGSDAHANLLRISGQTADLRDIVPHTRKGLRSMKHRPELLFRALDIRRGASARFQKIAKPVRVLLVAGAYGDPVLDRALLDEHALQVAPARRTGIALSLVVWAGFAIRDFSNVSGISEETSISLYNFNWYVTGLRLFGAIAILFAFASSLKTNFNTYRFSEGILLSFTLVCYFCLLGLMSNMDVPFDYVKDQPGLIVFLFAVISLFRLRMRTVLALVAFCLPISMIAFYQDALVSMAVAHIGATSPSMVFSSDYFIAPSSYLAAAMLIGIAVAGLLERDALQALLRENQLAEANCDLVSSRGDAEAKTVALVAAKDQLRLLAERESQQKSLFLADAAHDLSQPIHAISLLIEPTRQAVQREDLVQAKHLIEDIVRAVNVARSSFRTVLEASQLQSGLVKAALGGYDVEQLVAENLGPLDVIAKSQGVRLKLRRPTTGPVVVYTDPALFARLISNLTANAIKYSDPRKDSASMVLIGIIPFVDYVRIDILDNGIGISEQNRQKIFEPFVQLANPERNRDKGLGLGLSIVSAIIPLLSHHGLNVQSLEGHWTRFSLTVPRYSGAVNAPNNRLPVDQGEMDFGELYIFYVEDDETSRKATAAFLSDVGILVEVAASVAQVEIALGDSERRPDLIISDFRLAQGKTAVDVARLFRTRWDKDVPILVLTGETVPPPPELVGGAAVILRKPTAPLELIGAIQALCSTAPDNSI
jgi:signal transduction histidine kinase